MSGQLGSPKQNAEACFVADARDMQDVLGMQGRYA